MKKFIENSSITEEQTISKEEPIITTKEKVGTNSVLSDIFYPIDMDLDVGFCKNPIRLQGMEREKFIQEFSDYYIVHSEKNNEIFLGNGYLDFKKKLEKLIYLYKNNPNNIDYFESILKYIIYIHNSFWIINKDLPKQKICRDFWIALKEIKIFEKVNNYFFESNELLEAFKNLHIEGRNNSSHSKRICKIEDTTKQILLSKWAVLQGIIDNNKLEIPLNLSYTIFNTVLSTIKSGKIKEPEEQRQIIKRVLENITRNQIYEDNINRIISHQKRMENEIMKRFVLNWKARLPDTEGNASIENTPETLVKEITDDYIQSANMITQTSLKINSLNKTKEKKINDERVIKSFQKIEGDSIEIIQRIKAIFTKSYELSFEDRTEKFAIFTRIVEWFLRNHKEIKKTFLKKDKEDLWIKTVGNIIKFYSHALHQTETWVTGTQIDVRGNKEEYQYLLLLLTTFKEEYTKYYKTIPNDIRLLDLAPIKEIFGMIAGRIYSPREKLIPKYILSDILENEKGIEQAVLKYYKDFDIYSDGNTNLKWKHSKENILSWKEMTNIWIRYLSNNHAELFSYLKEKEFNDIGLEIIKNTTLFKIFSQKELLTPNEFEEFRAIFYSLLQMTELIGSRKIIIFEENWKADISYTTKDTIKHMIELYYQAMLQQDYNKEIELEFLTYLFKNAHIAETLKYTVEILSKNRDTITHYNEKLFHTIKEYFLTFLSDTTYKSENYYYILTNIFIKDQDYEKVMLYSTYLTKEQLERIQADIEIIKKNHIKEIKAAIKIVAEVIFLDEEREGSISAKEIIQETKNLVGYPINTLSNTIIIEAARDVFENIKNKKKYTAPSEQTSSYEKSWDSLEERFQKGNIYEKLGLLLTNIISPNKDIMYQYGEQAKIGIPDIKLQHNIVDLKLGNHEANITETIEKYQYIIKNILTKNHLDENTPYQKQRKLLIMTLSNNGDLRNNILKNYKDIVKFYGFEKILHLTDYRIQKESTIDLQSKDSPRLKKFLERKEYLDSQESSLKNGDKWKSDWKQTNQQIEDEIKKDTQKKKNNINGTISQKNIFISQLKKFQDILLHGKKDFRTLQYIEYLLRDIAKDYILANNSIMQEALHQKREFSWDMLFKKRDIVMKYINNEITYEETILNPLFKNFQEKIETQGMCLVKSDWKYTYKPIPKDEKFRNPFVKRDWSTYYSRENGDNKDNDMEKREKKHFEERWIDINFQERECNIADLLQDSINLLEEKYEKDPNPRVVFHINEIAKVFEQIHPNVQNYINQSEGKSYDNKSENIKLKMLLGPNLCNWKRFQKYSDGYYSIHYEQKKEQYLMRWAKESWNKEELDKKIELMQRFRQNRSKN